MRKRSQPKQWKRLATKPTNFLQAASMCAACTLNFIRLHRSPFREFHLNSRKMLPHLTLPYP